MIGDEAREVVPNNTENLDFYAPTVNLSRDPRWGRNDESWSEDPTLTADLASQYVDGLQGQTQQGVLPPSANGYYKAIATLKHYAANNSEVNRRTGSSDMDQRTLREYYTAQFASIIQQSHPGSIMSSYNEVNGVPAAASVQLMDTLARQTFGFNGLLHQRLRRDLRDPDRPPLAAAAGARAAGPVRPHRLRQLRRRGPGLQRRLLRPVQLRQHDPDRDRAAHHDPDRRLQRGRRRHLGRPAVHRPHRDRRVRRRVAGAVGGGRPRPSSAGTWDEQRRQQRRHRDPGPAGAGPRRRPTRASCC